METEIERKRFLNMCKIMRYEYSKLYFPNLRQIIRETKPDFYFNNDPIFYFSCPIDESQVIEDKRKCVTFCKVCLDN